MTDSDISQIYRFFRNFDRPNVYGRLHVYVLNVRFSLLQYYFC